MRYSLKPSVLWTVALALVSPWVFAQAPATTAPATTAPAMAPAAPSQPAVAQAPESQAQQTPSTPVTKPRGKVSNKAKKKLAHKTKDEFKATGPVATYPGFRMLPDGSSRVFVQVNKKVPIQESKGAGRIVYKMKGVQAYKTNRLPLVTAFFATPVSKVTLVGQGEDLDMVIELRVQSDSKYRVMETERGIVLQVDFPQMDPNVLQKSAVTRQPTKKTIKSKSSDNDNEEY